MKKLFMTMMSTMLAATTTAMAEQVKTPLSGMHSGKEWKGLFAYHSKFFSNDTHYGVDIVEKEEPDKFKRFGVPKLMVKIPKKPGTYKLSSTFNVTFYEPPGKNRTAIEGSMKVELKNGRYKVYLTVHSDEDNSVKGYFNFTPPGTEKTSSEPAKKAMDKSYGGGIQKLIPPVTLKASSIKGKDKDRKAEIKITNKTKKSIKSIVVKVYYLSSDGTVGNDVPHTHSPFNALDPGKSFVIDISDFFMKEDTAKISGEVAKINFTDGTTWPAFPSKPPVKVADNPVSAQMIGVIGSGKKAAPAVACFNYDSKDITSIQYKIEYLAKNGDLLKTTGYGYMSDKSIMKKGTGMVITGGAAPPEGTANARINISSVAFADKSKWSPTKKSVPKNTKELQKDGIDLVNTSKNLIKNPGNEMPVKRGEIPEWKEIVGKTWGYRNENPAPQEGNAYFFSGATANAELRQDVNVSKYLSVIRKGQQAFEFEGYVSSWKSALDTSRIIVEFLDRSKRKVLDSFDSGEHKSPMRWDKIQFQKIAPKNTYYIRVRLITKRNEGKNNDGYFDNLSLKAIQE